MLLLSIHPILSKVLQFILSLSIIVIVHEFGHFLPAKLFGCRIEKFYLFFDAWFSVIKKKVGDTVYGIGWIPLGGYVKISGMIDESMDKESLQKEPQEWEFRSKKPWQKLIVMAGGVFLNLVLGAIIFIGITYVNGDEYLLNKNLTYGIHPSTEMQTIGLQNGDIITKVGTKEVDQFSRVLSEIILSEANEITVLRNKESVVLPIPQGFIASISQNASKRKVFVEPRIPSVIDSVAERGQFAKGHLMAGDKIVSFNNKALLFFDELVLMKKYFADSTVIIGVERAGKQENILVKLDSNANLGISVKSYFDVLGTTKITYSFFQSIPVGIAKAYHTLANYLTGLKLLFTSKEMKVKDNLGSPISIGNMFPANFSWEQFWILTAVISISIGIMNLMPIPALDGGHIIFALYEWITGKMPNLKVQEYAQTIGMILLFGLMFYAIGLDLLRIFK